MKLEKRQEMHAFIERFFDQSLDPEKEIVNLSNAKRERGSMNLLTIHCPSSFFLSCEDVSASHQPFQELRLHSLGR